MTLYCEIGDIARVTFPDGSVRDYSNSPVDITVIPRYQSTNCASLRINVDIEIGAVISSPIGSSVEKVYRNLNYFVYELFGGFIFKNPYPGLSGGRILYGQLWGICRGREISPWVCLPVGEYRIGDTNFGWTGEYRNLRVFRGTTQLNPTTYQIIVKNTSGGQLFSGIFTSPNYSVECVSICPPNTLDCGDCCLPCDELLPLVCQLVNIYSGV